MSVWVGGDPKKLWPSEVDEVTRTVYEVTAKRWSGGWELHIADVGVTQSRTLDDAEAMVRDYIAVDLDVPEDSFDMVITPELGGQELKPSAATALAAVEAAAAAGHGFTRALDSIASAVGSAVSMTMRMNKR